MSNETLKGSVELDGIGVQVFSPDLSETEPGQWRFVRFMPCPLGRNRRHCKDEHHHWGRGDHVVPLHSDWMIGEPETAPSLNESEARR